MVDFFHKIFGCCNTSELNNKFILHTLKNSSFRSYHSVTDMVWYQSLLIARYLTKFYKQLILTVLSVWKCEATNIRLTQQTVKHLLDMLIVQKSYSGLMIIEIFLSLPIYQLYFVVCWMQRTTCEDFKLNSLIGRTLPITATNFFQNYDSIYIRPLLKKIRYCHTMLLCNSR